MTTMTSPKGWPLDPSCPCDVHFVEYFRKCGWRDRVVFHFGSGLHHLVGQELGRAELGNEVLAITASRDEQLAYVDRVHADPEFGRHYRLLYGDIYALSARVLPRLDVVTLFHLGEGYDGAAGGSAFLRELALVELFLGALGPDGRLLFYDRSIGREPTQAALGVLEQMRKLHRVDRYETLSVYAPGG